ncbi:hypothetical protein C4J93_2933 [Pseudomonas sp. R2-37-08W]|uniref:hypothetical protein n=1 Tax=Pseudomonas sp. R2-37-08W TaxID=1173273 RepID=UPI000F587FE2|nr:hypothetical protein [Pseudomonas sp. R2-37-08W]AZF11129.1 hypothetical protein C4J93_2933 [Pseudomonas sp. R2-37-08W]
MNNKFALVHKYEIKQIVADTDTLTLPISFFETPANGKIIFGGFESGGWVIVECPPECEVGWKLESYGNEKTPYVDFSGPNNERITWKRPDAHCFLRPMIEATFMNIPVGEYLRIYTGGSIHNLEQGSMVSCNDNSVKLKSTSGKNSDVYYDNINILERGDKGPRTPIGPAQQPDLVFVDNAWKRRTYRG